MKAYARSFWITDLKQVTRIRSDPSPRTTKLEFERLQILSVYLFYVSCPYHNYCTDLNVGVHTITNFQYDVVINLKALLLIDFSVK